MAEIDPVILELRADLNRYQNQLRSTTVLVESSLSRQERAVERLEFEWQRTGGAIGGSIRAIGAAAAGFVSIDLARRFLSLADSAKQIDAQLRLATQSFGSFNQAQADSERIASQTRSGLQETSTLYGSFLRTSEEIGRSQDQASQATENFTKALKVGGAGTQQVQSATLQMGQALASANVQWEELGQILEASPRLARVFTDALGVTRSELKKMAEDGKLTGAMLFDALNQDAITAQLNKEFAQLPITFQDAMVKVSNAAIITFGAFDRGGQFSTALANFVSDGADGFKDLERAAEELGVNTRASLDGLSDAFEPFRQGAVSVFGQINAEAQNSAEYIRGVLQLIDGFRNAPGDLVEAGVNRTGLQRFSFFQRPGRSDMANRFERGRAISERTTRARARLQAAADRLQNKGFDVKRDANGNYTAEGLSRRTPRTIRQSAPATGGGSTKKTGGSGPSANTLARRAEADAQRQLRNDEAFANEKSQLEQDLLRARAANVTAAETLAAFERQEIEAQRVRQNASYQADVAQKRLTQARADELVAVNDKLAAERMRTVNLRKQDRLAADRLALASSDLETARDFANIEGELADTQAQRKAAALRLLDLEFEQERLRLEAIEASLTATDAEKEIARRRLASLDGLQAGQRAGVERQFEGPLARYRRGLNDPTTDVQNAVAQKLQDVDDAIANAAADTLGVKDPFLRQLLQIFLQQNVLKPLYDAVAGASGGSAGGFLGTLLQIGKAAAGFAGGGGGSASTASFGKNIEIGNILGRASGGYVPPRGLVRVNEGGPGVELLRMGGQGGTVIPLGQADRVARPAQPMVLHQTIHVDGRNSVTPAGFARQILDEANRAAAGAAAQMGQAVIKAVPARLSQFQGDGT